VTLTRFSGDTGFVVGEGTLQVEPGELQDEGALRFGGSNFVLSWARLFASDRLPPAEPPEKGGR
jgi:hypothetical protein